MAPLALSFTAALVGAATVASAYTPNRPGSEALYGSTAPYSQAFLEGYSVLKHIGGQGPYSNRQSYGIGRDPPGGCAVDQVIMLKRHGERWPDPGPAANFLSSVNKIYQTNTTTFTGSLEFLNRWQYFVPGNRYVALESYNGPYAGLLDGYRHGAEYGTRYGHLWDATEPATIPMFSSGYERILMTARRFGEGFFGWNYTDVVAMNIIPEEAYMGANSLTPTCIKDNGTAVCSQLTNYQPQFDVAASRLNAQVPNLRLNATDIYNLMQMTAYELNVRGYSDWVHAFSLDEWVAFGYTQDLQYYYCNGPGDKNMRAVGAVYANASLTLLNEGPDKTGKLFFNFCHDTNITPVLAALGISSPADDLPLDHIPFPNDYNTGNIVPMGGHLTIERLTCNATSVSVPGTYVRLILNEAVVPYTGCQDGPGFSCSLANYTQLVSASLPDFISTCGFNASYPQHLDFWWSYNTTKAYDNDIQTSIPAEEGLLTYQGTAA
ncbi:3-phytase B [Niveomyces insectorum RCEF 264]|uniref:3-phytase n=1 Tax=Niveomyces insectorum RCEF 264 TaxID=1081102 RepID=A0A167YMX2_9HYPO|nr:3-phytase B [Niveomyces insectorum RCEF 264]